MNHTCPRSQCKYEWDSRVKHPRQCPKCKRYLPLVEFQNQKQKEEEPQNA